MSTLASYPHFHRSQKNERESYVALCTYLKGATGVVLDESKRYLVESKLQPIIQREGLGGLGNLIAVLERGLNPKLADEIMQAMTVNETFFFRDRLPFDAMSEDVLPKLLRLRSKSKRIRIWSAACSTGQEPYSLAMLCADAGFGHAGWQIEILATDLNETVLKRAGDANYNHFEVSRGLSSRHLKMYFQKSDSDWTLAPSIRNMVVFRRLNLLSDYSMLGMFDIIFCRNVLIYMDTETKQKILRKLSAALADDGYICLGASESITNDTSLFQATSTPGLFTKAKSKPATGAFGLWA